jgi:spore coat polysaccharide biosynthesis predicted glycosyltransferase SpsG
LPESRATIRVDASARIGGGHVMRCLALAYELSRRGVSVTFVAAAMPDSLATQIRAQGHAFLMIDPPRPGRPLDQPTG